MLLSAGITVIPFFISVFMHLHLKGKRIADFPPFPDDGEEEEGPGKDNEKGKEDIQEREYRQNSDTPSLSNPKETVKTIDHGVV